MFIHILSTTIAVFAVLALFYKALGVVADFSNHYQISKYNQLVAKHDAWAAATRYTDIRK